MRRSNQFRGRLSCALAIAAASICVISHTSVAQSAGAADSVAAVDRRATAHSLIDQHQSDHRWLKLAGVAVGATVMLAPFDERIAAVSQRHWLQGADDLQSGASTAAFMGGPGPFLLGASLYAGGVVSRHHNFADVGLHLTEGVALAASLTALGKGVFGRSLPNDSSNNAHDFSIGRGFHRRNGDYVSFPSGHTAAAFAMASVISAETDERYPSASKLVRTLAYGGGVAVGLARIYQNVHWASDLPLAALIGTWSGATVVSHQHKQPHNGLDQLLYDVEIMPSRDGLVVGWTFR